MSLLPILFKTCYDCLITHGGLVHLYQDLCAERKIHVNATTKLDEAHVIVNVTFFPNFGVSDNTSRHCPCYLSRHNFFAVWSTYNYHRPFIFRTCLGKIGFHEITIVVVYLHDCPFAWNPVGVYISQAHKYGDHQSLVMEILFFINLFYHHNMTICWSYDRLCCWTVEHSHRTAKKVQQNAIYNKHSCYNNI